MITKICKSLTISETSLISEISCYPLVWRFSRHFDYIAPSTENRRYKTYSTNLPVSQFPHLIRRDLLFSLGLGRSKVLVLRFGPKMNTKVAFNTHPLITTTLNFLTSSRHSRRLKLGIQLNQTKSNPKGICNHIAPGTRLITPLLEHYRCAN